MGVSPVELIIATEIEPGPLSYSLFPNKQAVPRQIITFVQDSNQVGTHLPLTNNNFVFDCYVTDVDLV